MKEKEKKLEGHSRYIRLKNIIFNNNKESETPVPLSERTNIKINRGKTSIKPHKKLYNFTFIFDLLYLQYYCC
jgi:hypothetical protein